MDIHDQAQFCQQLPWFSDWAEIIYHFMILPESKHLALYPEFKLLQYINAYKQVKPSLTNF